MVSFNRSVFSRETYDILKFLGDLGGLHDALRGIGLLFVGWYSSFNGNSYILSKLYVQSTQKFQSKRKKGFDDSKEID